MCVNLINHKDTKINFHHKNSTNATSALFTLQSLRATPILAKPSLFLEVRSSFFNKQHSNVVTTIGLVLYSLLFSTSLSMSDGGLSWGKTNKIVICNVFYFFPLFIELKYIYFYSSYLCVCMCCGQRKPQNITLEILRYQ